MAKNSVKLYTDDVLTAFYDAIKNNTLDRLHIPHSDVFYVRKAVEAHYGRKFTLKEVEDAMNNPDSPNYEKYIKIRKLNLHKMEPIPVCKIPK